jgi:gluconokinase
MSQGLPLTDLDRSPWLAALRSLIDTLEEKGESAVLACSALKKTYRDELRSAAEDVVFVYLKGDFNTLHSRLKAREKHYMKEDMLASQFEALEEPEDALVMDVRQTPEDIVALIAENYDAFSSRYNP